jgi:hypothetical protein
MSENALTAALRRLGYSGGEMTWHGFRAMASTRLNEAMASERARRRRARSRRSAAAAVRAAGVRGAEVRDAPLNDFVLLDALPEHVVTRPG